MSSLCRLASNQLIKDFLTTKNCGIVALVRPVTLQAGKPSEISQIENYDERNMKLNRPQSPHLSIYAPQLTSMLSISHRFTGMALAGYTVLFGLGAVTLPDTIPHYIDALAASHSTGAVFIGKLLIAFPLSYHFWNGIRHLSWDLGKFLTIREVYTTGYIMLVLAGLTTAALCFL